MDEGVAFKMRTTNIKEDQKRKGEFLMDSALLGGKTHLMGKNGGQRNFRKKWALNQKWNYEYGKIKINGMRIPSKEIFIDLKFIFL